MARLKEQYVNEIAPALNKKFGYKSVMQIPKLDKVIINVAAGEAKENAKVIDDEQGVTLASASSMDKDFNAYGGNVEAAKKVGENIAKKCLEKGITEVVYDRGGFVYHGRVQALAEGAREAGLKL